MEAQQKDEPFAYLSEVELNGWDGVRPLIVFDGVCLLCSAFIFWVIARDKDQVFLFTSAQSALGQSFYKYLNMDLHEFERNLVIVDGRGHQKMATVFAVCRVVGGPWRLIMLFEWLPRFVLDRLYDFIRRHRFAWFGRREVCLVPDDDIQARFIL